MARSGALNPASLPFFPGGIRISEDDGGSGPRSVRGTLNEQDRMSTSSASLSPSEYRSARSTPSPPLRDDHDSENNSGFRLHSSPPPVEGTRLSPAFRQLEAGRSYPAIETRVSREESMLGTVDLSPEGGDTPGPIPTTHAVSSFYFSNPQHQRLSTPPVAVNHSTSRSSSFHVNGGFTSTSPVSSLDSGSHFTSSLDQSFEAQLKASPMIHDILDRLTRCEYSAREMQRDLNDVHRKVNLLLDRSLGTTSQPEFKDPFAPVNPVRRAFSPSLNASRHLGGVAPNQPTPSDDITQISQRLNTLTASVGQILALQTQHNTHPISGLPNNITNNQVDLISTMAPMPLIGHNLPIRPDLRPSPRVPNPPIRTWSAGTLDLPMRPDGRQDALRDKRRSVSSNIPRRDSSGILDPQGDNWPGGLPRDTGPMISKWEQLTLAPDLLRSLAKFGVGPPNKIQQRALPFLLRGADIIAQAPPTQERIAAYVIPAIQIAVTHTVGRPANRGPIVIMISTTVDQATQAQRMIRDLGGSIGVRSALGVGTTTTNDLSQELRLLHQNMPHIICGTPQKLHALFTSPGGLVGSDVRFLVLDEVDQLIARNLHEFVFNIVKLLPPPRSRPLSVNTTPTSASISQNSFSVEPTTNPSTFRRFSGVASPSNANDANATTQPIERQTALFSNTVPQDVLNLASAIHLREPVRVLVRRDGNVTNADTNQGSRGLRQFYLYLAFTAGGRSDPLSAAPGGGLGIIGSGRGASNAESAQAREWKLDALADLFDDVEVSQAIVHVGGMNALDSVVYKLASRGLEAVPLHGDMNAGTKLAALNKFRSPNSIITRQPITKVLVVYDVSVKTPEVLHVPLIINYDLPKAVEEYAHRVSPAVASNYSRAGVVVNFVTATGGDVEMLRSIECFYKIKCPEVPMSLRDIV